MGLAGPRKRAKLAHDPNNTKWTRDTGSFGHKIMAAHGWQPGEYLGAKNAAHAEHFTAANASHIRVVLKDDNLGLGAKKGSGQGAGECTGLDVFKNLLGRLNGQDEDEMEAERKSKEDLRNAIYAERKWGSIRFVSGGFLVGDKIQDLIDREADRVRDLALEQKGGVSESSSDSESESEDEKPMEKKEKREKKRKADDTEDESGERLRKKEKKSKKSKDKSKDKSDKKSKDKSKKRNKSEVEDSDEESSGSAAKKSKKNKKEKKEKDKEDKKSKRSKKSKSADVSDDDSDSTSKKSKKDKKEKRKEKESRSGSKTPVSDAATPDSPAVSQMLQGRHAVRARNIAQKRMAVMDMAQLNQIFMIKS